MIRLFTDLNDICECIIQYIICVFFFYFIIGYALSPCLSSSFALAYKFVHALENALDFTKYVQYAIFHAKENMHRA